ncbi:MAG: hypothetical protein J0I57_12455 [Hyphomicrobium sp.]|nr:hypothetical protein [Hyphomicrobium sp.]MBN9278421.1 hypothetical protein [Hyphomicrobium sp.]OJU28564.1 MAG: hypothetical protein BGN89_11860 [Alphaproteobacteria bacterium 64-6]
MADKKSGHSLTDKQRADLKSLADKTGSAYQELRAAVDAAGPGSDFSASCRRCPSTTGGPICSSFEGDFNDLDARCTRSFCGHPYWAHVG